ncbi:MAG: type II secretion system F family protein [Myxococcota bacterium]
MDLLLGIGVASVGASLFAVVYLAVSEPPVVVAPRVGLRGLKRQRAMEGPFAAIDPLVRMVASVLARLPIAPARRRLARSLRLAGDFMGLSADEYLALTAIFALVGGMVGLALLLVKPWWVLIPVCAVLGGLMPFGRMSDVAGSRQRAINQALPGAMELSALCMGAGLDFPGALRALLESAPKQRHPLYEELERILQELELGRTREQALTTFADRAPTSQVRDLVSAVVQAERKGTPLQDVLRIQADLQRKVRSNRIEENASKATVKMTVPMLLLLGATMIMLLAPPILKYLTEF